MYPANRANKTLLETSIAPINSRLYVVMRSPTRLDWVEMAVGLPESPSYPKHSPHTNHFIALLNQNDRRKAAHSFFEIGQLFSFFSCLWCCCCCCWLPDPFRGMGAWRETMEPQKPGNSPGSGPEIVQRQRVAKE